MFKTFVSEGTVWGHSHQQGNAFFFFGTRHLGREHLSQFFPQWEFCFLKQVHGVGVIEAQSGEALREGDAHFTRQSRRALVVQTADCVPVLLASQDQICAVHAGWRGLAKNILAAVRSQLTHFSPHFVALGPHIGVRSFEVGQDVAQTLLLNAPNDAHRLIFPHTEPTKVYFDLKTLARIQLSLSYGGQIEIQESCQDTFRDPLFHSYRRDATAGQRQFSFVVLNK